MARKKSAPKKERKARVGKKMKMNLQNSIEADKKERKARRKRAREVVKANVENTTKAFQAKQVPPHIDHYSNRIRSMFGVRIKNLHVRSMKELRRLESTLLIKESKVRGWKLLLSDSAVEVLRDKAVAKLKRDKSPIVTEGGF